jgi:hypothetical protein
MPYFDAILFMRGPSGVSEIMEPSELEIIFGPHRGKTKEGLVDCFEFCDSLSVGLVSFGFGRGKSVLLERVS